MWYAITMRKNIKNTTKFIAIAGITCALILPSMAEPLTAEATTVKEIKDKINQTEQDIKNINSKIDTLSDEQDLIQEKIDDLTAEIVNTMTSIGMKEDEIAEKEQELVVKQSEIDNTEQVYYVAKEREEKQYDDMKIRLRRMYENGSTTYVNKIVDSDGLGDVLNRMDYVQKLYQYDQDKLTEFEQVKNEVHDIWDQYEEEKADLQNRKDQLEEAKKSLESQKKDLDTMLAKRKKESANYDAEIKKAKQEASVAKKLLQQEKADLKKLQEAEKKKGQTQTNSAANITVANNDYTSIIDSASGTDLGRKIAKYGTNFIGNPYVSGGTNLRTGADCSGFTYRIYSDFGYSIPRTSREQRSAGVGVSYDNAQPGDLICYDGHVGMYIGGGYIVHASNAKTGIKVSKATYRSILAVRRII